MGASFQAPHAAPGQRQMETSSWVDLDGLFVACYNTVREKNNNNNNYNNNDDFGSKKI